MLVRSQYPTLTRSTFDSVKDTAHPDLVRIKVGRTADVSRRLREHRWCCPSFKAQLLGQYPPATPRTHTCEVPFAGALERLVHLELTDLAAQSNPSGRTATRVLCPDCQYTLAFVRICPSLTLLCSIGRAVHVEIFTFKRTPNVSYDWEWRHIVRPVFERWGRFVSDYVG